MSSTLWSAVVSSDVDVLSSVPLPVPLTVVVEAVSDALGVPASLQLIPDKMGSESPSVDARDGE